MDADALARARRRVADLEERYAQYDYVLEEEEDGIGQPDMPDVIHLYETALKAAAFDLIAIAAAALAVKAAQAAASNNDPIGWGHEVHRRVEVLDAALERFAGTEP